MYCGWFQGPCAVRPCSGENSRAAPQKSCGGAAGGGAGSMTEYPVAWAACVGGLAVFAACPRVVVLTVATN